MNIFSEKKKKNVQTYDYFVGTRKGVVFPHHPLGETYWRRTHDTVTSSRYRLVRSHGVTVEAYPGDRFGNSYGRSPTRSWDRCQLTAHVSLLFFSQRAGDELKDDCADGRQEDADLQHQGERRKILLKYTVDNDFTGRESHPLVCSVVEDS